MKNLWIDNEANAYSEDSLSLRIYTSRLMGLESELVLHGGGNTSVKVRLENIFGESEEILFIKGSGQDLSVIDRDGFTPVRLSVLKRLMQLERIEDADLVRIQRSAMTDPDAPAPSIEALVHAFIPFKYVDHTHADAVVSITNSMDGEHRIRSLYQDRVVVIPYVHPGFELAKTIQEKTNGIDWDKTEGLIILNHGLFTFADRAKDSYDRMISLVTEAEGYLLSCGCPVDPERAGHREDLPALAEIRRAVAAIRGGAVLARLNQSPEACGFAGLPDVRSLALKSPLTADHIIRTKPTPVVLERQAPEQEIDAYTAAYGDYIDRYDARLKDQVDPSPRWAVWPGHGCIAFGETIRETGMVTDITEHLIRAIQVGEALGGWEGLSEKQVFDMEFWPLQRAKLKRSAPVRPFCGKIALVTGAASGIGRACAEMLHASGAAVAGLDLNPEISSLFDREDLVGMQCDMTDDDAVKAAVEETVRRFGGLDILVPNAGIFTASRKIEEVDTETWNRSLEINLSSNQRLLRRCIPFLKMGVDAAIVFIASKNVPAPGPGASAYSVAKAGLTQLARVAALELGPEGIRVNVVHPNAVYDTALWTPEVLENRACHYGCTVEEYKTRNCLKAEVSSTDVAELVCAMAGKAFAKTTGAQVPIDGGNDRVI